MRPCAGGPRAAAAAAPGARCAAASRSDDEPPAERADVVQARELLLQVEGVERVEAAIGTIGLGYRRLDLGRTQSDERAPDAAQALREHGLVIGEVTLSSGRTAQYYVDARRALLLPGPFRAAGELVAAEATRLGAAAVGGPDAGRRSRSPARCSAAAAATT